jgi:hypothetical protein
MTRTEAWCIHLAALGVGGTGLVYGWMRYLCEPADELAVVNHPLEPALQHLHLWLAPLLVFAVGLVWSDHVWKRVRTGFPRRRRTGLVLFALFWPMVLSGVGVQVLADERAHAVAVWVHALASGGWLLGYGVHLLTRTGGPAARPASGG